MRLVQLVLLLWWCWVVVVVPVEADVCPGYADCSGNGRCVMEVAEVEGRMQVMGCHCFDNDLLGHFGGRFCQFCLPGYGGDRCTRLTSSSPSPPGRQHQLPLLLLLLAAVLSLALLLLLLAALLRVAYAIVCYRVTARFLALVRGTMLDLEAAQQHPGSGAATELDTIATGPEIDDSTPVVAAEVVEPPTIPTALEQQPPPPAEDATLRTIVTSLKATLDDDHPPPVDATCKICFDRSVDSVLLECGHSCACFDCARQLKVCPFCRTRIAKVKKIFRL